MNNPRYEPLAREQLNLLMAPGNEELQETWNRLAGALHSTIKMLSTTYPRPLYWNEPFDRQRIADEPDRLRDTPFHAPAVRNVRAAEEIERLIQTHGHTPELHEMVDGYLDALLDEFDAIRLYPEIPPREARDDRSGWREDPRRVAGTR